MAVRTVISRIIAAAVGSTMVAAGCGGDDASPPAPTTTTQVTTTSGADGSDTTSTPATTTTEPAGPTVPPGLGAFVSIGVQGDAVTVEWLLSGGEPSAERTVQIPLGTSVRIEVTADRAEDVHLHGYDLTADLAPGVPGTIDFVADAPGNFEVELEQSGFPLIQLEVS